MATMTYRKMITPKVIVHTTVTQTSRALHVLVCLTYTHRSTDLFFFKYNLRQLKISSNKNYLQKDHWWSNLRFIYLAIHDIFPVLFIMWRSKTFSLRQLSFSLRPVAWTVSRLCSFIGFLSWMTWLLSAMLRCLSSWSIDGSLVPAKLCIKNMSLITYFGKQTTVLTTTMEPAKARSTKIKNQWGKNKSNRWNNSYAIN